MSVALGTMHSSSSIEMRPSGCKGRELKQRGRDRVLDARSRNRDPEPGFRISWAALKMPGTVICY